MNMIQRLIGRVSGRDEVLSRLTETQERLARVAADLENAETRLAESSKQKATGIKPGWGYQSQDMTGEKHGKLRALADSAFTSHPIANKAMMLKESFICQEGFRVTASYEGDGITLPSGKVLTEEEVRERVQDYLDEHWEINWEGFVRKRTSTVNVLGELALWLPPSCNSRGQYEVGMIASSSIESVEPNPLNIERADRVKFSQAIELISNGEKNTVTTAPIVKRCWRSQRYVGEVLYLGVNTLAGKHRGISDLTPIIDYLEVYDQLVWTEAERVKMLRSLMFQYIMHGEKDKAKLIKKQVELSRNPPPPGTFVCTNESVEIKEICPSLNSSSSLEFIKYIFGLCAGCLDLPEHFFYSAGDVNRASAREMTDPIYARVRNRKREIIDLIYTEHAYALQRAAEVEGSPVYSFPADALAFVVESRDPERDALDVIGQHLTALGQALVIYKAEDWISQEQAGRIARQAVGQLGMGEIEEPEEQSPEEIVNAQLEKLDRVRTIDGQPENFPLSPTGEKNWKVGA